MTFHVPNKYRIKEGRMGSTDNIGNNGAFRVKSKFNVIASDQGGWEHVSVSMQHRCPNWKEMCQIKSLFWDDEDVVIQYHPAKADYVNIHPHCLHLWRPIDQTIPTPPSIMIGPKR